MTPNNNVSHHFFSPQKVFFLFAFLVPFLLYAQEAPNKTLKTNDDLLEQFVNSKGNGIITFDATNIKQFWVDSSVLSRNNNIEILLNKGKDFESIPFKIQLANINETQDCKIEVISDSPDFSFSVLNNKTQIISSSKAEDAFLGFSIASSSFHLEDTSALSFYLKFYSKTSSAVSIKKIILSFSNNKNSSFLVSPGILKITADNIDIGKQCEVVPSNESGENAFVLRGKIIHLFSKNKILVTDNTIKNSLKVKNIGNIPLRLYLGYTPYTKDGNQILQWNNPVLPQTIMKVVSSVDHSNKIIVDSYPKWSKGCYLALNAKEDLSDFPNFSIIKEKIIDIKELEDNRAEITFERPIKNAIAINTPCRIQQPLGASNIYTMPAKVLQPGEEATFSTSRIKDDDYLQYSSAKFCRGCYYIVPMITIENNPNGEEGSVLISDFTVSY